MKPFVRILILCFLVATTTTVSGQKNKISLGTQIPINYCASYEEHIYGGFYINYHFGYLTQPYVKVLFAEAEKRGLDPIFSNLLENYFHRGICHQVQLKYAPDYLKRFYVGALYKRKNVSVIEVPYQDAADNFGIDLTAYEDNPVYLALIDDLDFNISMSIPGVYVGRSFQLGKSNWSMYLEASFQKIIYSNSIASFTGSGSEVPLLNEPLNHEVRAALDDDGNLYTLNVGISYTLPVSINRAITSLFKKKEKE